MIDPDLQAHINAGAAAEKLPATLVSAMVLHESSADIYAYKSEPAYRYLWNVGLNKPFRALTPAEEASEHAPIDFPYFHHISSHDTEWWGQQASWGPLQLMGAVAREYGFHDAFPALCSVTDGLTYPLRYLAHLVQRFQADHGWEGVVAAYNAGSPRKTADGAWVNQVYVDAIRVLGGFDGLE